MPAVSKQQQKAAGMALAAKRGQVRVSELQGAARQMYHSMSEEELREIAKGERSELPQRKGG